MTFFRCERPDDRLLAINRSTGEVHYHQEAIDEERQYWLQQGFIGQYALDASVVNCSQAMLRELRRAVAPFEVEPLEVTLGLASFPTRPEARRVMGALGLSRLARIALDPYTVSVQDAVGHGGVDMIMDGGGPIDSEEPWQNYCLRVTPNDARALLNEVPEVIPPDGQWYWHASHLYVHQLPNAELSVGTQAYLEGLGMEEVIPTLQTLIPYVPVFDK